jgi:gas vesicle protein
MTHHLSTSPPEHQQSGAPSYPGPATGSSGGGMTQTAKEQGREVAQTAKEQGHEVAQTAKEQGREVVAETTRQARNIYGEARQQLTTQAGQQQRRAAGGLRSVADEMRAMAEQGGQSGPVSELARQAADRVHGAAGWLEQREPGDLLTEVRDYARRNPGTFLVGAALLGVLAGRLTKGITAGGDDGQGTLGAGRHATGYDQYAAPAGGTGGYPTTRAYEPSRVPGNDAGLSGPGYAEDPTVVLPPTPAAPPVVPPTPAAPPVVPPVAAPPVVPPTPGPTPPVTRTDPLPGVPSTGAQP